MLSITLTLLLGTFWQENASPWPYQHIDKTDGLSNSAITSVYMDRHHYVWFGSWDGLNRFDGTSIKVYKPDSFEKGTISNNIVRNLLEDRFGNLWIVTHRGVNRYDRNTDTFRSYLTDLEGLPFLEYNTRIGLGPDSTVWVAVTGKGVSRYDAGRDAFVPLPFRGLDQNWLYNVTGIASNDGIAYLLGNDGKLVSTINNRTLYSKQLVERTSLRLHHFFRTGEKMYLALSVIEGELLIYDLADMERAPQRIKIPGSMVSSLSAGKDTTLLWVGTESGGIFKIIRQQGNFQAVDMAFYFPQFAKDKRKILHITETAQDLLWVGTDGDGVFKFLTRPKPFYPITAGPAEKRNISNSIVRSVYEDRDGTLYIGTRGGGLNILRPGQQPTQIINPSNGLSHSTVLSLNKDKHGNLWVGTDGEGIDMVEAGTGKIFHFPRDFENKTDLAFQSVYAICIDAYGDLWLGTSGYGVIRMKVSRSPRGKYRLEEHRQITYTRNPRGPASINSNVVYTIVEETPNILWFGTRGAGIYRYNSLTDRIEEHFYTGSRKVRLSNDDVLSLCMTSKEELWIGTSGGVNKLSLGGRYQNIHYTQRDGLPNNTIHAILEDKDGMIWLSTNNGLIRFDPEKNTFKTFDSHDGLQNNEFTDGASFRSTISERLFFGGIDGLDIIFPGKLDTASYFPRLTITEFQVHNMIITPGDSGQILQQHIDLTESITLNYDQNFISFRFTTLDYWNKQRTEYAYFLENFDKDWNYIGSQSVANLTNIPPGKYRLLINHTNENGTWNPSPKVISITVKPPFWRTTWAYALYVILLIGLQAGIILYMRQRARAKRAAAMDRFRIKQMKELNDYKLQFFTNIAHEFRTPLTLIMGPLTSLMKRANSLWEKAQLKAIYNNSLRLQKLIEELIQFRKIESGKEMLQVRETDLIVFTQEIVESFHQHAQDHEVHLEFIPETDALRGWIDPGKLEKILINLISNAIKYNHRGGHVEVKVGAEDNRARFTVRDTGPGIPTALQEKIFEPFYHHPASDTATGKSTGIGLSLTKSLVQVHNGTIELISSEGNGSSFIVTIPVNRDAYPASITPPNLFIPSDNLAEKVLQEFSPVTQELLHPALAHVATHDHDSKAYSILVADDNEQITILLQNILSDRYRVFTAKDGQTALKILDDKKIDLVISDVLMPNMDGLTLCRTIKDNIQTSHIPVILLTAKAGIEDRIEGLQVGADSYIPKPFHPDHLFIRIEKLIESREQIRKRFSNLAEAELEGIATGMGAKDDEFFVRITDCILRHLSDPDFGAETIAEEVGMSKASLYKKVKALTGLTPHGLIKQYRLRKAADLLKHSTMSVSEVIYETGFNSRSYFYKSFNEMFHCHPRDFERAKGA